MEKVTITHAPEMYENIFNTYSFENNNGDHYTCYSLLNKVTIPKDVDPSVYDHYSVPAYMPLTTISYKLYQTMYLWWLIMVVNNIRNPVKLLAPGTVIRVIKQEYLEAVLASIKNK